ncbi:MAG: hypothetical protein WAV21_02315 [Minisyncoccia bacterium]
MLIRGAIALVLVILLGYAFTEAKPLLWGPLLTVVSPLDGATVVDGFVNIEGTVERAQSVTLNGSPLLFDELGHFSHLITLPQGGAILSLTANDRFGRTVTKRVAVVVP